MDRESVIRRHMDGLYASIWEHFDRTRHAPWKEVVDFVARCEGRAAADIGSGNGRHAAVLAAAGFRVIALDTCLPLLRSASRRDLPPGAIVDIVQGDMTALPLADSTADVALMIAGIHHLPSEQERTAALFEMRRVMAPGGKGMVSAWGVHQRSVRPEEMRRELSTQWGDVALEGPRDMFVPWKEDAGVRWRYYHFFTEDELVALASNVFGRARAYTSGENVFVEVEKDGDR